MKKVLIIAYNFPPAANVGIYRTVKFSQYLPEYGWTPIVLTVRGGKFAKYDARLLKIVPSGLAVHRARSIEWLNEGESGESSGSGHRSLWDKLYGRLCRLAGWFCIPDNKVSWVPFATLTALNILRRENIRYVYVTGKPFSSFLIGALLKSLAGVKLIVDYRDPWTQNITYERRSPFHHWIERRLEQGVIHRSDTVIANTRTNEKLLVEEFGSDEPRDKFVTIHNGFDRADYDAVPAKRNDAFTITYAGAFYFAVGSTFEKGAGDDIMRTYSPYYFFEALKKVADDRPDIRDDLRVNFMGVLGRGIDRVVKQMSLEGVVQHLGYLDYDEHISVLKGSDALLLVLSRGERSRGWIPSKLFSYLGSGKPVLAMVPSGEVRDIIEATRGGICVPPDDVDAVAAAVVRLYEQRRSKAAFERDESVVARFERHALTRRLADVMDSLAQRDGREPTCE